MSPQFTKRIERPMTQESYLRAANKLRQLAEDLEANQSAATPEQRKVLTRTIKEIAEYGRTLVAWHRRTVETEGTPATERKPEGA